MKKHEPKLRENLPIQSVELPTQNVSYALDNTGVIMAQITRLRTEFIRQRKPLTVQELYKQLFYPREEIATAIACMKDRKMRYTVTLADLPVSRRGKLR